MNMKAIFAVLNTTEVVVKISPENNSGLIFLGLIFTFLYCLSSVHYCKDHFHIHYLNHSSHIHDFHIFTVIGQ